MNPRKDNQIRLWHAYAMVNGMGRVEHRDTHVDGWLISHLIGWSFCAGVLLLNSPEKYHYLKQSGCYGDPSINDKEDFNNVMVCNLTKLCKCICITVQIKDSNKYPFHNIQRFMHVALMGLSPHIMKLLTNE